MLTQVCRGRTTVLCGGKKRCGESSQWPCGTLKEAEHCEWAPCWRHTKWPVFSLIWVPWSQTHWAAALMPRSCQNKSTVWHRPTQPAGTATKLSLVASVTHRADSRSRCQHKGWSSECVCVRSELWSKSSMTQRPTPRFILGRVYRELNLCVCVSIV